LRQLVGAGKLSHSDRSALLKTALDPSRLRIVIVDAHILSRDALRAVLEAGGGYSVVGAACDGAEASQLVHERRPHVLLLDLAIPRVGGLDALRQLRDTGVPTVVLADALTDMEVVDALTLGARGVLLKDALPSVLYECVRTVAEGAYWIGNERVPDVVDALRRVRDEALSAPAERLSLREL
jgi:two-component system, NarL family, nitrate/nitrite response regulator NarL